MIRKLTKEEIDFIKSNYPKFGGLFCASKLNLTISQIRNKVNKLKLTRKILNNGFRICNKCLLEKTINDFYKDNRGLNKKSLGVAAKCKHCFHKEILFKRKTNPRVAISYKLRQSVYKALRSKSKSNKTMALLGCDKDFFIKYITSKMTKDMKWQDILNGKIHIDHIKPISSFDLTKPEEQLKCFHYTNLQPLWAKDNLSKGNKIIYLQPKSF
jgi:hypothetical protein